MTLSPGCCDRYRSIGYREEAEVSDPEIAERIEQSIKKLYATHQKADEDFRKETEEINRLSAEKDIDRGICFGDRGFLCLGQWC